MKCFTFHNGARIQLHITSIEKNTALSWLSTSLCSVKSLQRGLYSFLCTLIMKMSHYKMYMIQSTVYLIAPSSLLSHYLQKISNTPNGKRGERAVFFSIYTNYEDVPLKI